ncbi:hypothetical protein KP509_01G067100 [Ceratopteris richardii]|uniref:Uncharacterized protein n=1 Tax=Ceratopteris richardii TaxID=49495 RepID=A0A8T2VH47_CERRI|nr:hypothetical protein KP509_01G067100 [Ceratopteris richardii]
MHMDPDKDNRTSIIMQIDLPKDDEVLLSWLVGNLDCCQVEIEELDNPSEFVQMSKESAKQGYDKALCEALHAETCTGNRSLDQKEELNQRPPSQGAAGSSIDSTVKEGSSRLDHTRPVIYEKYQSAESLAADESNSNGKSSTKQWPYAGPGSEATG